MAARSGGQAGAGAEDLEGVDGLVLEVGDGGDVLPLAAVDAVLAGEAGVDFDVTRLEQGD